VFILYALLFGLIAGFLVGGRLGALADLHLRWSAVIIGGLVIQILLFSEPVTDRIGNLGPPIYVASTVMVIVAILVNRAVPGMLIVALGAASNLTAILANGGYMPADPGAIAVLGMATHLTAYSNSAIITDPVLWPLTDIFVLPRWVPLANVFSVGDLLIGVGIAVVIAVAMRAGRAPATIAPGSTPAVGG
jgi:hypothetical protein